jgi:hypothetical protein
MRSEEFLKEDFTKKKGTYAALRFSSETIEKLLEYIRNNDIPKGLDKDEFHSTLLYSRKFLPEYKPIGKLETSLIATPINMEIWPSPPNAFKKEETNCLILKYECDDQVNRFDTLMDEHEATYDYDEYKPHTTLSYDIGDLQLEDLDDVNTIGNLEIIEEYGIDLDLDTTFDKD